MFSFRFKRFSLPLSRFVYNFVIRMLVSHWIKKKTTKKPLVLRNEAALMKPYKDWRWYCFVFSFLLLLSFQCRFILAHFIECEEEQEEEDEWEMKEWKIEFNSKDRLKSFVHITTTNMHITQQFLSQIKPKSRCFFYNKIEKWIFIVIWSWCQRKNKRLMLDYEMKFVLNCR